MHKKSRLPPGKTSPLDSSMISLWFALRAAVLRLAVSPLWPVALDVSRGVAAELAHRQNASMVSRQVARPVATIRARARQCRWLPGHIAAGPAVRANPAFKRTAYGRRLTPR